jgi:hypothetical protein
MNSKIKIFAICVFVVMGLNSLFAQDFKEVRKSFTIEKAGRVILDTYKGNVTIEPSGSDVVDVYAKIEADEGGLFSTSAKKQLANANVIFEASSNSVSIKSEYKHNDDSWFGGNTRALINYVIKMPKGASLTVKDYKSYTDIYGLESSVEFETYKGTVKIKDLSGSINLETYKGGVDVKFAKLTGDSRFETYKGDITLYLPKSTAFSFNSDFGKHVDFDNDFNISNESYGRKHKSYNYNGDVNGGGSHIKISSEKGNISLRSR